MIKRLVIKDCLGITELVLSPKKVNIISGGNEKGKTSILETIEKALFNTKRRAKFVRAGSDKAYIELETDDGISIKRTVLEDEAGLDKGSVKVSKDGHPVKAPETYLKELFGATGKKSQGIFAFNPVDFMQKKDTEQTDILLSLMPINVTAEDSLAWFGEAPAVNYEKHGLQVLKALEQWFYDARTEANAKVKAIKDECAAVAKRLPDNYKLEDWEQVNLGQLFAKLRNAEKTNQDIAWQKKFLESYSKQVESINNKYALQEKEARENERFQYEKEKVAIKDQKRTLTGQILAIDSRISMLEKEKDNLNVRLKNLDEVNLAEKKKALQSIAEEKIKRINEDKKSALEKLNADKEQSESFLESHQPIDTVSIDAECEETEKMKSYVPLAKEVANLDATLEEAEETAKYLDDCVVAARKKPHELLAKVELPVKGLGIDGKGIVTINGLPLSNLSTSMQVRSCLDIARALAKNTILKLICVDKVEHLDETVRAEFLKQIEADMDYQYFVTVVTKGDLKVEVR